MHWIKKGQVYTPVSQPPWSVSHGQVPKALSLNSGIRIYFGTRDEDGRTTTAFVDTTEDELPRGIEAKPQQCIGLGKPGHFDDCGVMPASVICHEDEIRLYYTGWTVPSTVSYHLEIGLALSSDGGKSFNRYSDGPIIGRSIENPISCAQPAVIKDEGKWKMWYLSFTDWVKGDAKLEPCYLIKYAESKDGMLWDLTGEVCVGYQNDWGAIANPSVWRDGNGYHMICSARKATNYRKNPANSYRLAYTRSTNGRSWDQLTVIGELDVSDAGWDSEMVAYANVLRKRDRYHLFYNGNGFGRSGFGWAVCEDLKNE